MGVKKKITPRMNVVIYANYCNVPEEFSYFFIENYITHLALKLEEYR
jgi:hypothetical protein